MYSSSSRYSLCSVTKTQQFLCVLDLYRDVWRASRNLQQQQYDSTLSARVAGSSPDHTCIVLYEEET